MNRLAWYRKRLSLMSIPEVVFRAGRGLTCRLESAGITGSGAAPAPESLAGGARFVTIPAGMDANAYARRADRVLEGHVPFLGDTEILVGPKPDWNRNAKTGQHAPMAFGKTLNYRDLDTVGDIKYIWVPNRHLQLVTLAQAHALTGREKYLHALGGMLSGWMEACPPGRGPNWTSSLELAIRLINWSIAWQLMGGADSALFEGEAGRELRSRWLASVYRHLRFVRGHLSRYSSANNHLIGELAGIVVATVTWPFWEDVRVGLERACETLEREILLQNFADGVNREQSLFYQHFVLDFLILAGLGLRGAGRDFSDGVWRRIEAMLCFLAGVMDTGGNLPQLGDSDDGYVVRLSAEPDFDPYRSLLATGAVLFSRPELKARASGLDEKTRWLCGERSAERYAAVSADPGVPARREYPEGGYYLLGTRFGGSGEVRMLVDAGSLGYPSIAAHGHADALSLLLSLDGREILIDPGTYSYQSDEAWRQYFRGTSAHNTLRIDGLDQSEIGGKFMWITAAEAGCSAWTPEGNTQVFEGWQNGYQRLSDPVRHERCVEFDPGLGVFLIRDRLSCAGAHRAERFWHFSERCELETRDRGVTVSLGGISVSLTAESADTVVRTYKGSDSPPLGWCSRRFMSKVPTWTVVFQDDVEGETCLESRITYSMP